MSKGAKFKARALAAALPAATLVDRLESLAYFEGRSQILGVALSSSERRELRAIKATLIARLEGRPLATEPAPDRDRG